MNIIGLSAFFHDSACCLLKNGKLVAAVSEERFSRLKNDPRLPVNAFRFCLHKAGLSINDIHCLAYYESPRKKLQRQRWSQLNTNLFSQDPGMPERLIRRNLGYEGPIEYFDHHLSHGASSYFFSGFSDAAVFTVDGVGEWATTTYGEASGNRLKLFDEVHFPHSLGLFYAAITAFLGFKVNSGEYKVMGLAPYGQPKYRGHLGQMIKSGAGGGFHLDLSYFDFIKGRSMFSPKLEDLIGMKPRVPESELTQTHMDLARSVQDILEELLLEKLSWLHKQVPSKNLCMAGGVALNCVANGRNSREGPFKRIFIQPAAGDAGSCLGAAALAYLKLTGKRHDPEPMQQVFLGPSWSNAQLDQILKPTGLPLDQCRRDPPQLIEDVAALLAERNIVGWFQGAMEFGPRALGARSILANPMDPHVRDRLNHAVKKRESFRPFAPSVLEEHTNQHFDLNHPSPFMLETCQVTSSLSLPGITHVNGSARPQTVNPRQNPLFAQLLQAFYRQTGCPMLVNTSFNVRGEPIVCSPTDALLCFCNSGLDVLVLGNLIIPKTALPASWSHWFTAFLPSQSGARGLSEKLYTFV